MFTGRRVDEETGLQLNRNRFYHQQLGRWVSRDPIGYLGGWNLYEYVGSHPVIFADPTGEITGVEVCIAIGIGIWIGSMQGCEIPDIEIDDPPCDTEPEDPCPSNPPPPPDLGMNGPCEGNSNECCIKPGDAFNRPNPNWPPPGSEHLLPGQGEANAAARAAG